MSDEVVRDPEELETRCPPFVKRSAPPSPLDEDERRVRVELFDCEVSGRDLSGRSIHGDVRDVSFRRVSFDRSSLKGFRRVQFSGCGCREMTGNWRTFRGCSFFSCELIEADLSHATIRDTRFTDCTVSNANLEEAYLQGCSFASTEAFSLKLRGALLIHTRFEGVESGPITLDRADFRESVLVDCDLRGSNLYGARFDGALLVRVDLRQANLASASFTGARLVDVQIDTSQLEPGLAREIDDARMDEARGIRAPRPTQHPEGQPGVHPELVGALLSNYVLGAGAEPSAEPDSLAALITGWKSRSSLRELDALRVQAGTVEVLVGGRWHTLDGELGPVNAEPPSPEEHTEAPPPAGAQATAPEPEAPGAEPPHPPIDEDSSPLDTGTFRRLKHLEID